MDADHAKISEVKIMMKSPTIPKFLAALQQVIAKLQQKVEENKKLIGSIDPHISPVDKRSESNSVSSSGSAGGPSGAAAASGAQAQAQAQAQAAELKAQIMTPLVQSRSVSEYTRAKTRDMDSDHQHQFNFEATSGNASRSHAVRYTDAEILLVKLKQVEMVLSRQKKGTKLQLKATKVGPLMLYHRAVLSTSVPKGRRRSCCLDVL